VFVHLFIARRRVRVILALQLYAAIEFRIHSAPSKSTHVTTFLRNAS
jgi:hypothetical protein